MYCTENEKDGRPPQKIVAERFWSLNTETDCVWNTRLRRDSRRYRCVALFPRGHFALPLIGTVAIGLRLGRTRDFANATFAEQRDDFIRES